MASEKKNQGIDQELPERILLKQQGTDRRTMETMLQKMQGTDLETRDQQKLNQPLNEEPK